MSQTTCTARVQVTVEIDAGSTWGEDCPMKQVYDQAGRESVMRLRNILAGNARVIGEPKVVAIMSEKL